MATTLTATKIAGVAQVGEGGWYEAIYTGVADTTTAAGLISCDLTDDWDYIYGVETLGQTAALPYAINWAIPGASTAVTATNVELHIHVSAGDGDPFDSLDSTDVSTIFAGITFKVMGKRKA